MVALSEFLTFDLFVGKGLDNADAGERVLETGVDVSDLPAVFHKCLLHPLVLAEGEQEHEDYENDQRQGKPPVDQEKKDKSPHDLYH